MILISISKLKVCIFPLIEKVNIQDTSREHSKLQKIKRTPKLDIYRTVVLFRNVDYLVKLAARFCRVYC